ncbi:MAG: hypothetical protein JXD23_02325 [Spirochaetales bacterium]|nr:hypothetical protein [Spirochaetales bacterium]
MKKPLIIVSVILIILILAICSVILLVSGTEVKEQNANKPDGETSIQKEDESKSVANMETEGIRIAPDEVRTKDTEKNKKISPTQDVEIVAAFREPDKGYIEVSVRESGELYIDDNLCEVIGARQKKTIIVEAGNHSLEMRYFKNSKQESCNVTVKKDITENVDFTYEFMSNRVFLKDIRIDSTVRNGFRFVAEFEGYYRFFYKKGSYDAWPAGACFKNSIFIYKNKRIIWDKGLENKLWPSQSDYIIGGIGTNYESFESAEKDAVGDYVDVYLLKNDFLIFITEDTISNDAGDVAAYDTYSDNVGAITLSVYTGEKGN